MMVEGTFLALGVLAWVFLEVAREGIEKQRLLDLAHDRGVELDERRAQRAVAAGHGALLEERILATDGAGGGPGSVHRAAGPAASSFALDFAVALRTRAAAQAAAFL